MVTALSPVPMIIINSITVYYKNGKTRKLIAKIYRDAFTEAFKHIQKKVKIDITINDVPFL